MQLLVLDLDGTLAPYDAATAPANVETLKKAEQAGVRICLCSGKPVFYLCAFMRQFGLQDPILIGENGAEIQFGYKLPPPYFYRMPYSERAEKSLRFFEAEIKKTLPEMWFQPNKTELSPFPKSAREFEIIDTIIANHRDKAQDIRILKYHDCFDFIPVNINKGAALRFLADKLGISTEEICCIGDSKNDFPMFEVAGKSYGIKLKSPHPKAVPVGSLEEALDIVLKNE